MDCKEFTKKYYVDRKNTDCIKWDREDIKNKLPMFIADMDFKCDEKIIEAMQKRIAHGSYGYSVLPKDYYDTVIAWNKKRNKVTFKKDWIRFTRGAVDALYQLVYSLTKPKDAIIIATPVYPPFAATIKKTGRTLVETKLVKKNGLYTFNYEDLEKKIKEKKVKAMILCSPHNPMGRVWTKEELTNLFKITHKHHVLVISDEVHSDLIMSNHKFIPSLAIKEYQDEIVSVTAASKTFSLALYSHCHIIIPNKKLRDIFDKYQSNNHLASVNVICALPTYYGYKYGESWLNDVNKVIEENYNYMANCFNKLNIEILPLEGTYLVFADFKKYAKNAYNFLVEKCGIVPNAGETFAKGHESWARINLATSLDNIKLACSKIEKACK